MMRQCDKISGAICWHITYKIIGFFFNESFISLKLCNIGALGISTDDSIKISEFDSNVHYDGLLKKCLLQGFKHLLRTLKEFNINKNERNIKHYCALIQE